MEFYSIWKLLLHTGCIQFAFKYNSLSPRTGSPFFVVHVLHIPVRTTFYNMKASSCPICSRIYRYKHGFLSIAPLPVTSYNAEMNVTVSPICPGCCKEYMKRQLFRCGFFATLYIFSKFPLKFVFYFKCKVLRIRVYRNFSFTF